MATNFKSSGSNLEDLYIRKDLFSTGGLWSWGRNASGQLADNTTTGKSSPVQTVATGEIWKYLQCASSQTAVIKNDGTLWMSGGNTNGQLGDNTLVNKSSPVQTVSGGTNWKTVSPGSSHTVAIKTDGTLWLWGRSNNGQLGDNTLVTKSSPVQTVAGGTNWGQVSCGGDHTAAIKTDGTLWMWGFNASGQLGDNTVANKSSPVQTVAAGTNWKLVAGNNDTTAAIKTDGTLWLWGNNNAGQLGDNTLVNKSSPVQTVSGGTNWKSVALGAFHAGAIKTDGTLWLWGSNSNGQLGDNTIDSKSSPVQTVSGGTNWKSMAGGASFTATIKTDGTLWTFGINNFGNLGNNNTTNRSSPVQTVSGGTNWKSVSCGTDYAAALRE